MGKHPEIRQHDSETIHCSERDKKWKRTAEQEDVRPSYDLSTSDSSPQVEMMSLLPDISQFISGN